MSAHTRRSRRFEFVPHSLAGPAGEVGIDIAHGPPIGLVELNGTGDSIAKQERSRIS